MRFARRLPGRSSLLWPAAIAVVLGVVLIGLDRGRPGPDGRPGPQSTVADAHRHEAYGIYVCDAYLPQFPDNVATGLSVHTHNDGLIHVEPRSPRDSAKATFGRFAKGVGLVATQQAIHLPDGRVFKDGDSCDGEDAEVRVIRDGRPFEGNVMAMRLRDGSNTAIVFAGADKEIPPVPFIANLDDPLAGETGSAQVTIPPDPS